MRWKWEEIAAVCLLVVAGLIGMRTAYLMGQIDAHMDHMLEYEAHSCPDSEAILSAASDLFAETEDLLYQAEQAACRYSL